MGNASRWKQKQISPSSDISLSTDVYTWLETEIGKLNLPFNSFICIIRENYDMSTWAQDDFICATFVKDQPSTVNKQYGRCRGTINIESMYIQMRNFITIETCNVYANETYTIFY